MKALLVDDEGLTREGLALLIQVVNPDIDVTSVHSSAEAIAAIDRTQFDFIFLDVALDGESGLEFLDRLKDAGITTPVIMLSNHDDRDTVMDALSRGAFGFLPKQTENPNVIRQAMELALKGGVYLPPSARGRGGNAPPSSSAAATRAPQVKQVNAADLNLSPRLYETAYHLSQGLSNKGIARQMGITENVAAEYVKNVFQHLNVSNRPGFMVLLNRSAWQLTPPH
jgi:DNA-binding NarL/FixJ family response regulator